MPATGQGASERASGRRTHQAAVGMLTASVAALYCVFALTRYHTFHSSSYDLVIFDQAVRSYAHFQPGISIIKGVHNGFGPHFSVLGDHWSPILATLAPLYWIYSGPQTLLVAQAVLFALAIPPLWIFTRRAFGGGQRATAAAYLVSVAYGLSWPIAEALNFSFHEVAFAPVLTAVALERLQAGRLRTALIALAALLFVKEDMGLFVAGIGLYLAVARPRTVRKQLLTGLALIVVGFADTYLATYALVPAFGGRANYYWAYTALGQGVPQAVWHLIVHPASSLRLLITPRVKLDTMLFLFGAFCFLPLRSPIALAAVPLLLERMLANLFPNWWVTDFQYNAYLVVVLVFAAVDGAARLDRWWARARQRIDARRGQPGAAASAQPGVTAPAVTAPAQAVAAAPAQPAGAGTGRVALLCAIAMCVVAVGLIPQFAFGAALHPSFYKLNARARAAAAAVAVVPSGVTVEAVNHLGPQLSARDTVLLWERLHVRWAPWVVADVRRRQFTFASQAQQAQRIAFLERSGYRVVFERKGYVVLHRAGASASTGTSGTGAG